MSDNTNEHAEVGALLARCDLIEVGYDAEKWWATASLSANSPMFWGYGTTQLAAIRAAVEAAEKGVRE